MELRSMESENNGIILSMSLLFIISKYASARSSMMKGFVYTILLEMDWGSISNLDVKLT